MAELLWVVWDHCILHPVHSVNFTPNYYHPTDWIQLRIFCTRLSLVISCPMRFVDVVCLYVFGVKVWRRRRGDSCKISFVQWMQFYTRIRMRSNWVVEKVDFFNSSWFSKIYILICLKKNDNFNLKGRMYECVKLSCGMSIASIACIVFIIFQKGWVPLSFS